MCILTNHRAVLLPGENFQPITGQYLCTVLLLIVSSYIFRMGNIYPLKLKLFCSNSTNIHHLSVFHRWGTGCRVYRCRRYLVLFSSAPSLFVVGVISKLGENGLGDPIFYFRYVGWYHLSISGKSGDTIRRGGMGWAILSVLGDTIFLSPTWGERVGRYYLPGRRWTLLPRAF